MPAYELDGIKPVVEPGAFVHPTAVLIGDVIVETECYVGPFASLRGDFGRIILKRGSNLQDHCCMHGFPESETIVEENGHIGHGAILHGCLIKNNALIGMNAVIMDGAVIGESAIVGAMAFVKAKTVIPGRSVAVGNPARVIRQLNDKELAWKVKGTQEYQELSRRCLASLKEVTPDSQTSSERPRMRFSDHKVKTEID